MSSLLVSCGDKASAPQAQTQQQGYASLSGEIQPSNAFRTVTATDEKGRTYTAIHPRTGAYFFPNLPPLGIYSINVVPAIGYSVPTKQPVILVQGENVADKITLTLAPTSVTFEVNGVPITNPITVAHTMHSSFGREEYFFDAEKTRPSTTLGPAILLNLNYDIRRVDSPVVGTIGANSSGPNAVYFAAMYKESGWYPHISEQDESAFTTTAVEVSKRLFSGTFAFTAYSSPGYGPHKKIKGTFTNLPYTAK